MAEAERQYKIKATKNPIALGMPMRRKADARPSDPMPTLELAGAGTAPHPKLPGRKDFEVITASERTALLQIPAVVEMVRLKQLSIKAVA